MFISAMNWLNVAIKTANFFLRHSLAEFIIFPGRLSFSHQPTNQHTRGERISTIVVAAHVYVL